MRKLSRLTADRPKLSSIVASHTKTSLTIIPGLISRCTCLRNERFILSEICNNPRAREVRAHKEPPYNCSRQIAGHNKLYKNQRKNNKQNQFQEGYGHYVSIQTLDRSVIYSEKFRSFKIRLFKTETDKYHIHEKNCGNKRQKIEFRNFGDNCNDATDKQTHQPSDCFENVEILGIFMLLHQPLKSIFDNRFHLISLKSLINSTFILTFTTPITK